VDWTNIDPSKALKHEDTTVENTEMSVLPDRETVAGLKPVPIGPGKVFQKGYPTGKTVRASDSPPPLDEVKKEAIKLRMSKDIRLLDAHGVADSTLIHGMLHPVDRSISQSLADQDVFLVTNDFKIVDVASGPWPLDVQNASDIRTLLMQPVQFKDQLGVVASCMENEIILVRAKEAFLVSVHDLVPIMLPKHRRLGVTGGK
jgi:hypothetical protein